MEQVTTIGIDLAKNVFQLHGADERGKVVFKKKLNRSKLIPFLSNLKSCLIGMEACAGSNHWAREIKKLGHDVKLISPQFVKPYVRNDKTDANDAAAIAEAVTRPHMRFVPPKRVDQQDLQTLHRVRERLVKARTALVCEVRAILHEYGITMPVGRLRFKSEIIRTISEAELTSLSQETMDKLTEEYFALEERISYYEKKLKQIHKNHPECQRLESIPGVGYLGATAILAAVSDPKLFKNGREFSAWLGLTPKQHSSGGKQRMLGISKRGDCYIRKLLIQGAKACMRWLGDEKIGKRNTWVQNIKDRRGPNKAAVALANKNARIVWALLSKKEFYSNSVY